MFTSFNTALSALNAASNAVSVVGNNLANLNTTGYKAETVQFSDLMSQTLGASDSSSVGLGVGPAQAVRQFTQGSIQQTTGAFDAAIQGNGFFVVRDQNNQSLFTRAGNFALDPTGHLQTASGENVQGWSAQSGAVSQISPVGDIVIPVNGVAPAQPTANISLTVNLNAAGVAGAASGAYATPIRVFDSQGGSHTLTCTFTKTATNAWDYTVSIPASDIATGGTTTLATGSLTFDGSGKLTSPAAKDAAVTIGLTNLADGAADQTVSWKMFDNGAGLLTQFAQDSGVSAVSQDGFAAAQISKVGLTDGGMLVATYSNGQQATIGQVALATIENPATMEGVGNNNLRATAETSDPAIGTAGSGGRGQIRGGSLESSTVDIATEFTNLISFQRTYQANSRVITTVDQMTQDLIGLIR
jgi:flagellar hook protein FlgE